MVWPSANSGHGSRDVRSSTKGAGSHILIVGVRHTSVDNLPIKAKSFRRASRRHWPRWASNIVPPPSTESRRYVPSLPLTSGFSDPRIKRLIKSRASSPRSSRDMSASVIAITAPITRVKLTVCGLTGEILIVSTGAFSEAANAAPGIELPGVETINLHTVTPCSTSHPRSIASPPAAKSRKVLFICSANPEALTSISIGSAAGHGQYSLPATAQS